MDMLYFAVHIINVLSSKKRGIYSLYATGRLSHSGFFSFFLFLSGLMMLVFRASGNCFAQSEVLDSAK